MEIRQWRMTACLALLGLSGCSSIWHSLQPEQLRKFNSGPPPFSDPQFTRRDTSLNEPVVVRAQNGEFSVTR